MSRVSVFVSFLGGMADGVNLTGSCYFLEVRSGKYEENYLIDAGLWQGSFFEAGERNKSLDLYAKKAGAVVLTHTHIDHIGRLPRVVRMGFNGPVFCTVPTADVSEVMLMNSADILKSEAKYRANRLRRANGVGGGNGNGNVFNGNNGNGYDPLFSRDDVEKSLRLVKNGGYDYFKWIKIGKGIYLKLYPSGHVLGGAVCVIRIENDNEPLYLGFSGDLGRKDNLILSPPVVVEEPITHWFTESTYGGISHPERDKETSILLDVVRDAVANNKKIIIPSFALERTQEIVYLLSYYISEGKVPSIPIYLDSPLASGITRIFKEYWNTPMFEDKKGLKFNPFNPDENCYFTTVSSDQMSADLSRNFQAHIVIACSGMCDFGRVRNHLRSGLPRQDVVICLVGHMAANSLGEKLKRGDSIVNMNSQEVEVNAKVISFDGFSAHADGPALVEYAESLLGNGRNNYFREKRVFILHGSENSGLLLKDDLERTLGRGWKGKIAVPQIGEKVRLV